MIAPKHGWRRSVEVLHIQIGPVTAHAFDYLEDRGWRFLVHFGISNAIEMAQDQWLQRMERTWHTHK